LFNSYLNNFFNNNRSEKSADPEEEEGRQQGKEGRQTQRLQVRFASWYNNLIILVLDTFKTTDGLENSRNPQKCQD
jgi:hypothetical protein